MEKKLPVYKCDKKVEAFKISSFGTASKDITTIFGFNGETAHVSSSYIDKHDPDVGGYYVRYQDGYESYSPAAAFETGYTLIGNIKNHRVISDQKAEEVLAGHTAPAVTMDYIESRISSVDYYVLPGSTVTICNITLDNGFSVRGESACVSSANFDEALGKKYSYERALNELWPFFGFALAERLNAVPVAANKGLNFGQAISALKAGKVVCREGWNGKGIFLELQVPDEHSKMTSPYIYIDTTGLETENKAAPKSRVPWLASQTDMLASDWMVG